jgi:hypothetical protein
MGDLTMTDEKVEAVAVPAMPEIEGFGPIPLLGDEVPETFEPIVRLRELGSHSTQLPETTGQASDGMPPAGRHESDKPRRKIPGLGRQVKQTGRPITHRESMQRAIVIFTISLLSATFGVLLVTWAIEPDVSLETFSSVILAPVLALTGPVLGFFFTRREDT